MPKAGEAGSHWHRLMIYWKKTDRLAGRLFFGIAV